MANKQYIGSGKSKGPKWIRATISEKGLQILADNLQEYNGNKFAKINISILNEPNKFGKDVEITLDDWKPESKTEQPQQQNPEPQTDMPF